MKKMVCYLNVAEYASIKAYLERIKKRKCVDKVELNRFFDHQLRFKPINKELKIYFFIMRERKEYLLNKRT
jgi:hypothetical protein